MRLVFSGLKAGLKKSVFPLILLFAALFFCAGAAPLLRTELSRPAPVRLAVVDEEQGTFSPLLLSIAQKRLGALAEVTALPPDAPREGFSAVLLLPRGFWQSVMDGENRPPVLRLSAVSPLEGLWAGALARSAARTIETAQRQIGGMIPAMRAAGLSGEALERFILGADLSLLDRYLDRGDRIGRTPLSATGALSLPRYLLCCAVTALAGAAPFLFWDGFSVLRRFAALARRPILFFSAALLACLLSALLWLPVTAALCGGVPEPCGLAALWLTTAGAFLLMTALPGRGACAAASVGLVLGQALLGGGFFPEALLPPALARAAGWFPLTLQRRALGAACFGAGGGPRLLPPALLFTAAAVVLAAFFWFGRGEAVK